MREEHAREGDTRMRHRSRLVHGGSGTGEGFSGEDDSREKSREGGWSLAQRFWAALISKKEPLMVPEQETELSESRAHVPPSLLSFPHLARGCNQPIISE